MPEREKYRMTGGYYPPESDFLTATLGLFEYRPDVGLPRYAIAVMNGADIDLKKVGVDIIGPLMNPYLREDGTLTTVGILAESLRVEDGVYVEIHGAHLGMVSSQVLRFDFRVDPA